MSKIFEVRTNLTVQKNMDFIKGMTEEDRQQILELDLRMGVDLVKEDIITSYLVCDEINIEKMKEVLKKHQIEYEISDVTDQVVTESKTIDQITEKDIFEKFDL